MSPITRREFLKVNTALGGSLLLAPFAIGQPGAAAHNKLNVALVGSGGIARTAFGDLRGHNVVAIAEVDQVEGAIGFQTFPGAARYEDFRVMLDKHDKELDLVIISTPDHTHFAATYAAMERGIAVHTQKPLTHNIWEARTLKQAAHKYNVQTVMGNQGHTMEGMRFVREWYEAGLLGTVREVHAWTNRTTNNTANTQALPGQTIPNTLNWDLWLGPRAMRPYNSGYVPRNWRWWWDFGLGGLGDIGCHTLDIPIYAMQLGYPGKVYMDNSLNFSSEVPGSAAPRKNAATHVYEFPAAGTRPPVTIYWYEGGHLPRFPASMKDPQTGQTKYDEAGGCLLVGDKNSLYSPGMRPNSPRLLENWREIRRSGALPPKTLPRSIGSPVAEIIGAIRGDIAQAGSNFDYAAPLTEIVILGTLANRSSKLVEFNPEEMTFKDASLNAYLKEPVRAGWEYGEGLI